MTPPSDTYIARLVARLAAAPHAALFTYREQDVRAGEFLASVHRYARALQALGVARTSVVALLAPNAPDAIAIRYAANLLGAAACYLSAPPSAAARAALIGQVAPTHLVLFPETLHLLPRGLDLPILAVGDCGPSVPRLDTLAALQTGEPLAPSARPQDLAVIISSGGSTGVPKGSCRDFASYTRMVTAPSPPDRRQLVNGHLAYLSEVLVDLTLLGGGSVVLRDRFDAADTLAQIAGERISDLFLVEPQLFELMDHPAVPRTDLSSLRTMVHVGASAPPVLRRRARQRLGPVIAHTYGASEEGLVSLLSPAEQDPARPETFTSAGRVLPDVQVQLRKPDGGLAAAGESGVIEVHSLAMAQGHRNQPDRTAQAFQDGWFHLGDLGRLNRVGHLHVLGRDADIARDGDRLITPTSLEDTLCALPSVRYAVVVVDPERSRRVAAVERWSGLTIDAAACHRAIATVHGATIAESLALRSVERVPLTEQGKPNREAVRQIAWYSNPI